MLGYFIHHVRGPGSIVIRTKPFYIISVYQLNDVDGSLTHWGRVMHICVSNLSIISPDNGLLPGRHQAIIWTNAGMLLIGPLGTNLREILIKIYMFSFNKIHLKVLSGYWRPFCLSLSVLTDTLTYFLHTLTWVTLAALACEQWNGNNQVPRLLNHS